MYEAHPELAFVSITGEPMRFNKKKVEGRLERLRALEGVPNELFQGIKQSLREDLKVVRGRQVASDDLLDACVLAWTAHRIWRKKAQRVPANPPVDRKGLRMEIWY
ncbi:MAG: DUF429 domain-containing protein, partial [Nitrospiraceae bacterium]